MEQMSRSIYALESKEQRSADEEQQLQQLLLSRSNLLDALKADSVSAASSSSRAERAHDDSAPANASDPSLIDSILSSVAAATHAGVGLAKGVAGLLAESAAETARLCAPPPPSLEQTLKQLDGSAASVPLCILHMLPPELQAVNAPAPAALARDTKELLSNFCEHTLLMDSSIHGRSNKVFHDLCDANGPSLALFLSGSSLFGYFLSKSSGMGFQKAPGSFMFSVFKDGCYRPALYNMVNSGFQLLPSAANGTLPVGWFTAKDEAGATYYWCESSRHVQAKPPLVDRHQMQLGPRCSSLLLLITPLQQLCSFSRRLQPLASEIIHVALHLPTQPHTLHLIHTSGWERAIS
jgi:hypothetical protein